MDGFQDRVRESVRLRLSLWLSIAILVVALIAGGIAFMSAFGEANELQDDVLRQVASLFLRAAVPLPQSNAALWLHGADNDESRLTVQYLAARNDGSSSTSADPAGPLALPRSLPDGMHTLRIHGEGYRVFVRSGPGGERVVVAQETGIRDEIAQNSALRTVLPLVVLMVVLLFVVAQLTRNIFSPITSLAEEIDRRPDQDLHPIAERDLPVEIRPFVVAINRMLERVKRAMELQARFVADAAHELRTPFTALSLQAERLVEVPIPENTRDRFDALRRGIERGRHLIDQLLTLARAQAGVDSRTPSLVSLRRISLEVLEDLMPIAEAKRIDVGFIGDQDAAVSIDEASLRVVIANILGNAIRFTPPGGRVDLSVASGARAVLEIRDSGPGIAVVDRERVFDPFHRVLASDEAGAGLGLAIVKAIAERVNAEIELAYGDPDRRTGLSFKVIFPRRVPSQA